MNKKRFNTTINQFNDNSLNELKRFNKTINQFNDNSLWFKC